MYIIMGCYNDVFNYVGMEVMIDNVIFAVKMSSTGGFIMG